MNIHDLVKEEKFQKSTAMGQVQAIIQLAKSQSEAQRAETLDYLFKSGVLDQKRMGYDNFAVKGTDLLNQCLGLLTLLKGNDEEVLALYRQHNKFVSASNTDRVFHYKLPPVPPIAITKRLTQPDNIRTVLFERAVELEPDQVRTAASLLQKSERVDFFYRWVEERREAGKILSGYSTVTDMQKLISSLPAKERLKALQTVIPMIEDDGPAARDDNDRNAAIARLALGISLKPVHKDQIWALYVPGFLKPFWRSSVPGLLIARTVEDRIPVAIVLSENRAPFVSYKHGGKKLSLEQFSTKAVPLVGKAVEAFTAAAAVETAPNVLRMAAEQSARRLQSMASALTLAPTG